MGNMAGKLRNGMTQAGNTGFTGGNMANPVAPPQNSLWGTGGSAGIVKALGPAISKISGGWNKPPQVSGGEGIAPTEKPGFISPMIGEGMTNNAMPGGNMSAPMAMAPGVMGQFTPPQMGGMPPGYTGRGNAQRRMGGPQNRRPVKY